MFSHNSFSWRTRLRPWPKADGWRLVYALSRRLTGGGERVFVSDDSGFFRGFRGNYLALGLLGCHSESCAMVFRHRAKNHEGRNFARSEPRPQAEAHVLIGHIHLNVPKAKSPKPVRCSAYDLRRRPLPVSGKAFCGPLVAPS